MVHLNFATNRDVGTVAEKIDCVVSNAIDDGRALLIQCERRSGKSKIEQNEAAFLSRSPSRGLFDSLGNPITLIARETKRIASQLTGLIT